MKKINFQITADLFDWDELPFADQQLMEAAREAMQNAYAPYSRFQVGAAVLLADGTVVKGNNQENAAYPSGLCAERTAFFAAGANHPGQKIVAVAITAKPADSPVCVAASPLLPMGFSAENLH
ncbi:MAG: cytidine deaminase [Cytophagales bacterium]|nr:cytidine deaminase [Cytophagales bacterium]